MESNQILEYARKMSTTPGEVAQALEKETVETHRLGRMVCGAVEASLIGFLLRLNNAKRVLELGTFTGYSALAMAEQLPEDGEVITIDKNKRINKFASEYWNQSPHGKKIKAHFGIALDVIPTLEGKFDLVFIDADKSNYKNYLDLCLPLLTEKGVIVADNVLLSGQALEELTDEDTNAKRGIIKFNEYVSSREDLYGTFLPHRDGVFLIQKV